MPIDAASFIGPRTKIAPDFSKRNGINLRVLPGAQILGMPEGSTISNLHLGGGASHASKWAALRGGVLKLSPLRAPIEINGKIGEVNFEIPSGHLLLDLGYFQLALNKMALSVGRKVQIPHITIDNLSPSEHLFLVHSAFCLPRDLFLPLGEFTKTSYTELDVPDIRHLSAQDRTLFLIEAELDRMKEELDNLKDKRPLSILNGLKPKPEKIIVQLTEGGHVTLTEK
jgi:hypothetical protein